ncbi:drug/metabolite transporter (DMT)-like permease [Actinoplanes lutulentus]|uniref:Threonine/homoserine efflux transporter RhtA n=1 Tax=Actinoplanes lutulentus TaxID=1287878 RepID=A0A327Z9I8_9ACTN|nr:DMT family transporter [Actinoplanes lutulentus]MBB2948547.1 drug/metabolite transporter (DMT)-like permease [Actinoplanes lutulentus]RAK34421.1 threonine/homoserine efflux transporter RhtA [Actinoplanes lutulentus]
MVRRETALVAVTAVWGGTFLVAQHGLTAAGPWSFVGIRFGLAALAVAAISLPALRGITRRELAVGTLIGILLAAGYGLQTVGLQTIPTSTSAFLTALYVPIVPLLQWLITRTAPTAAGWSGIVLAFGGLLLLTGSSITGLRPGFGEIVTVISSVAVAAEIVFISRFAGGVDVRRVTVVQLLVCSLVAFAVRPMAGEPLPASSWTLWGTAAALGVATAVIQVTINWAQRSVSATRATIIYAGEPVWAAVFGRMAGERLTGAGLTGGLLIVAAALISELGKKREPGKKQPPCTTLAVQQTLGK